jgi:dihydroorotate dehydrogenase (NAD+) catalytic subunit
MTINLAPRHKFGLMLPNPVMPAAGCYGLGREYGPLIDVASLGAIVVGPLTARPQRGSDPPRIVDVPGGLLLHTGLANPGLSAAVRQTARIWMHSPIPVIVHVASADADEISSCCKRLEAVETLAGIELGVPDTADAELATDLTGAARNASGRPLIVRLPPDDADLLCEAVVEAGADALTIAAPPRGTVWHAPTGRYVTGRLYGPFVLPLAVRAFRRVAALVPVPLIGCGGIHTAADAAAFLRAGALAVQVDSAIWHDPSCLARIAAALTAQD